MKTESQDKTPDSNEDPASTYYQLSLPDGSVRSVKGSEIIELARYGYTKLEEEANPTEDVQQVSDDELTTEERLKKAEEKLQQFELKNKQQEETNKMYTALNKARQTNSIAKENDKFHNLISVATLAKVNINPRLDYETAYKETLADALSVMEEVKEQDKNKNINTTYLKNSTMGIQRGGEGGSLIDTTKKFSVEDLKSGASRSALREFLDRSRS